MEKIKNILREYIKEKFEIGDDPDFTDDVHLFDEGFVDSFNAVEIIYYIEQTFNIKITQRDITLYPMNTIEEIATVINEKLS
ncbi:MAG: acyl carrier protein [Oscillospiraceae bacterium]|nr:acyl carrier protein [Oscillospiraceae bacterium]